jgi:hypothetical protein
VNAIVRNIERVPATPGFNVIVPVLQRVRRASSDADIIVQVRARPVDSWRIGLAYVDFPAMGLKTIPETGFLALPKIWALEFPDGRIHDPHSGELFADRIELFVWWHDHIKDWGQDRQYYDWAAEELLAEWEEREQKREQKEIG